MSAACSCRPTRSAAPSPRGPSPAAASAAFGSDGRRTLVRLLLPRAEADFGTEKCALLTLTMSVRRRGAHVGHLGWLGGRDSRVRAAPLSRGEHEVSRARGF
jgi:hypothetical protein